MAEVKTYRVDLPDGRFVNVQSDKELTEDQIRQVQEMAPSAEPQRGVLEGLLTGAATGVAPSAAFLKTLGTVGRATAGAGPMVSIPSSLLAGIAAAAVTGIGQRKAIEAISPETAKRIEETAAQQPLATMIGSAVTSGFKPGPALAESQIGRLAERAVPAALGGGIQFGTEFMEGEGGQLPEGAAARIATAAGINALLNRETALAQRIIGGVRPPTVAPELPKVKPPTPVTDNLGQVKAGESLPSATAKANQMAIEGGTAVPSPTEQLKQQTAATEAQTRAAQKDAETAQAEAAKAQQAAVELEQKFNEQEDLVVELQRLTGKPRDAIVASIPEGEIDPRLDFLRSEVGYNTLVAELQGITGTSYGTITKLFPKGKGNSGIKALQQEIAYRRNPLVADADRRIKELEAQVGGIERRGARHREEAIAIGEAQRAMEETTGRALAPEVAVPSVLEAPEAAMGEIPGRERAAAKAAEQEVDRQLIRQGFALQKRKALVEKAKRAVQALEPKGVYISVQKAVELAKLDTPEYNYAIQQLIDSVRSKLQGPAPRKPERLVLEPQAPAKPKELPSPETPLEIATRDRNELERDYRNQVDDLMDMQDGFYGDPNSREIQTEIKNQRNLVEQARARLQLKEAEINVLISKSTEATPVAAKAPVSAPTPAPAPAPATRRAARRAPRAMAEAPAPVPEVVLTERVTAPEAPKTKATATAIDKERQLAELRKQIEEDQKKAGWDPKWPFIPQDTGNKTFIEGLLADKTLTPEFKKRVLDAGRKLGAGAPSLSLEQIKAEQLRLVPEAPSPAPIVAPESPIPAVSRTPEAPAVPAPTPEAQIPVKSTEKAITEAPKAPEAAPVRATEEAPIDVARREMSELKNDYDIQKRILSQMEEESYGPTSKKEIKDQKQSVENARVKFKAKEAEVDTMAGNAEPSEQLKPATKPSLTKEEVAKNDLIDQTIESLDLARANLEPTSKIVSILKRSKLLTEGEIKLVQGAGKSMGPEDAATEAMSLLEFKKAEVKPVEAKAEVAAQTPDEVAAVKAIETGSVAPEAPAPTPAPATTGSLVPEAPPAPAPTTKANRLAQIKERFKKTNAGMTPKAVKAEVQNAAAEAVSAAPEVAPVPEAPAAPATQQRLQNTKGTVFDQPYSFYKKEEGIGVPWFVEVGGVEYPLQARSIGTAKTEAKRLAAEKLRPSGEELGFRAFMRMPSPGEPLAGAAIGYAIGDTEEERRQNAILGFQLGSLVSLGGVALGRRSANLAKLATNASLGDKGDFDIRTITRAELNAVPAVKNAQGQLIAPNGKPSNLSEFQWKAVRTDRFKNWFGDWQKDPANASKVVDANGEPLPVYHGTRNVFEGFDRANSSEETRSAATFYDIMSEFGDNFATSPEVASRFAEDVYKNSPKPGSPNVQKVFLNIRNLDNIGSEVEFKSQILTRKSNSRTVEEILVNEAAPEEVLVAMPGEEILTAQERINKYETDPDFRASINQEAINQERNFDEPSSETIDDLVRDWKRENPNVDGILYINEAEKETRGIADKRAFITFKPEQVKSVWNRGTWSPDDINTLRAANVWWSRKPKTVTQKEINEMPVARAGNDRDGFISQLMAYTKADSQSVYDKMVADNKINNTGVPSAQVAQDIAKAPVHHQKMLSDLASAFPMITKVPGGQAISDAIGSVAKGAEKYFGTAISNIASRSPRAAGAINTLFYEKAKQQLALWENGAQSLNDFTKTKLLKEQSDDFWRLARNGDVDGAKAILRTTEGGEQAVRNYDLVLEQRRLIREEAKANGIPMGDIGDALPSIVADVDGLLKYLGVEERGRYGKMLEAARKAKADRVIKAAEETGVEPPDRSTIALNSDEEVLVMSNYLTGIRNTTGKPGFLKGRSIETVDKEMDQFYAPGSVALKRYYDRWVDYKLNKQFFGKVRPDLTPNEPIGGNIAKILNEDYQSGGLDDDGLKRVQEAVRSLFHFDYKATNSLADKARKVQTFAMLSDISTAVIQFADLFTMAYAYGGPKGVINAFKPGKRVTLRDINLLENPNADIDDITKGIPKGGKIGRVVSATYEAPLKYLLGGADKINKEGLLNSAKGFIADTVQNPETRRFKDLDSYYSKMYPERWPAMLEDLRKPEFREGKLTDNTAFFLRNELAKFQPIDLAGRAEGYAAAGPWGKTLYTLRSYAIKQLDIIRRDVYENFKAANQTGEVKYAAKAIANMAAYAALVGAGQQLFRYGMDEALGRKIEDPKEYAIQGAMGIMLIPRYSIYRLGEQGLFVAAAEWAVPGSGILNDLQQDVKATGKYLAGQTDVRGLRTVPNIETYFKNLEATKFLPVAGREIYWWAGKGAEKTKKLELEALMGKERPSTLETIFRTFVPADLKTEMKP